MILSVMNQPTHGDDEDARSARKRPVAERVHLTRWVDDLRRGLGEALDQRIDSGRNEVRAEATRHTGKGAGDTGQRMPARGVEDDASERDDEDVPGVGSRVADDGDEEQHRREERLRRDTDEALEAGVDEAGVLRDADSEERDEDDSERAEPGEGRDHAGEESGECGPRELVLHGERPGAVLCRDRELVPREQEGGDPDNAESEEEQHGRIG